MGPTKVLKQDPCVLFTAHVQNSTDDHGIPQDPLPTRKDSLFGRVRELSEPFSGRNQEPGEP